MTLLDIPRPAKDVRGDLRDGVLDRGRGATCFIYIYREREIYIYICISSI